MCQELGYRRNHTIQLANKTRTKVYCITFLIMSNLNLAKFNSARLNERDHIFIQVIFVTVSLFVGTQIKLGNKKEH